MNEINIVVVEDSITACPGCGAYWGHPNSDLDYPNRQKVDQYFRCYNPECNVTYYEVG